MYFLAPNITSLGCVRLQYHIISLLADPCYTNKDANKMAMLTGQITKMALPLVTYYKQCNQVVRT